MNISFSNLSQVRAAIDALDRVLVSVLSERQRCIEAAAQLKAAPDDAVVPERIEEVVALVRQRAKDVGFSSDLAEDIWRHMIDCSIQHEKRSIQERTNNP